MSVSRRVLTRYIAQQLADGTDRKVILNQLAAYVVHKKLTGQIELVVSDIERNLAAMGTVYARVSSARPLSPDLLQAVKGYISRIEDASSVEIQELIDPDILGGIVIETPRKRFDASIATQLKRLSNV